MRPIKKQPLHNNAAHENSTPYVQFLQQQIIQLQLDMKALQQRHDKKEDRLLAIIESKIMPPKRILKSWLNKVIK
jgi:hypothetical protein